MQNKSDCLFCKIGAKEIPATILYEDETTMAFRDINPEAPTHILVIHKSHYGSIHDVPIELKGSYFGSIMETIHQVVTSENLIDTGYRVVFNSGKNAGQEVDHIHAHILGGRSMQWPPG